MSSLIPRNFHCMTMVHDFRPPTLVNCLRVEGGDIGKFPLRIHAEQYFLDLVPIPLIVQSTRYEYMVHSKWVTCGYPTSCEIDVEFRDERERKRENTGQDAPTSFLNRANMAFPLPRLRHTLTYQTLGTRYNSIQTTTEAQFCSSISWE